VEGHTKKKFFFAPDQCPPPTFKFVPAPLFGETMLLHRLYNFPLVLYVELHTIYCQFCRRHQFKSRLQSSYPPPPGGDLPWVQSGYAIVSAFADELSALFAILAACAIWRRRAYSTRLRSVVEMRYGGPNNDESSLHGYGRRKARPCCNRWVFLLPLDLFF